MTIRRRKLHGAGSIVFAPPAAEDHPLKIAQFRAWRVKEPVSNRRYTVVRLQSQGGIAGYGVGGRALAAEIVAARTAVMGRRATESEYIRAALRGAPALEAAVSNAMLDPMSRAKNVPIYPVSGRTRSGSRPGSSVIWKGQPPPNPRRQSNARKFRGFRPSLPPLPSVTL